MTHHDPYPPFLEPTRADVDDRPEPVAAKQAIEPCEDCEHVLCRLQRGTTRHTKKETP